MARGSKTRAANAYTHRAVCGRYSRDPRRKGRSCCRVVRSYRARQPECRRSRRWPAHSHSSPESVSASRRADCGDLREYTDRRSYPHIASVERRRRGHFDVWLKLREEEQPRLFVLLLDELHTAIRDEVDAVLILEANILSAVEIGRAHV